MFQYSRAGVDLDRSSTLQTVDWQTHIQYIHVTTTLTASVINSAILFYYYSQSLVSSL